MPRAIQSWAHAAQLPEKFMLVIKKRIKREQCFEAKQRSKLHRKHNVTHRLQVRLLSAKYRPQARSEHESLRAALHGVWQLWAKNGVSFVP